MSARDMFYPENKVYSKAENRSYAREKLIFNVTEDLLVIMEDEDISKAELARRLGKSKSYVTQVLSGARNMTLRTLSDMCFELGIEAKVELPVEKLESIQVEHTIPVVRATPRGEKTQVVILLAPDTGMTSATANFGNHRVGNYG